MPINISIGILNNYCYFPGMEMDASLVTNFPTMISPAKSMEMVYRYAGNPYYADIVSQAAANIINNNSKILPGVHINIKRFSDCGSFWPTVEDEFQGKTGGWASSVMTTDILDVHTDVIGVVGNQYSITARGPAQSLSLGKIPYCSGGSNSPRLSDKNNYPYFWRPLAARGIGEHMVQVLKLWNVKRVAIIHQRDDDMAFQFYLDIKGSLLHHDIKIVTSLALPTSITNDIISYSNTSLRREDARYIILSGQTYFNSDIYNALAREGLVGSNYVWMGYNPITTWGNDDESLYSYAKGYVYFSQPTLTNENPALKALYEETLSVSRMTRDSLTLDQLFILSVVEMFDCVMMMALGFDQLLKSNQSYSIDMLSKRRLQGQMNFTLFSKTGFNGIAAQPIGLNQYGDLEAPLVMYSFTGDYYNTTAFGETSIESKNAVYYPGKSPMFHNGSSNPPPDGPPQVVLKNSTPTISSIHGITIVIFAVTSLAVVFDCTSFIIRFNRKKTVLRSSLSVLSSFLVSMALFSISMVLFIGFPNTVSCHLRVWFQVMAFGILMTAVTGKAFMDFVLIVQQRKLARSGAGGLSFGTRIWVYKLVVLAGEVCLLAVWSVLGKHSVQHFTSATDVISICVGPGFDSGPGILLAVYNGLLLGVAIYFAFITREAEPLHNESTYSSIIVTAYSFAVIVFIPVLTMASPSPRRLVTHACVIWILELITMSSVFIPKYISVKADSQRIDDELKAIMATKSRNSGGGIIKSIQKVVRSSVASASISTSERVPGLASKRGSEVSKNLMARVRVSTNVAPVLGGFAVKSVVIPVLSLGVAYACPGTRYFYSPFHGWQETEVVLIESPCRTILSLADCIPRLCYPLDSNTTCEVKHRNPGYYVAIFCELREMSVQATGKSEIIGTREEIVWLEFRTLDSAEAFKNKFMDAIKLLRSEKSHSTVMGSSGNIEVVVSRPSYASHC
ncbi:periplasmic binding protein-like I [Obelidium mucronatum]|nr:periplasmic binding protein-like I [Obelidium mucronatum]